MKEILGDRKIVLAREITKIHEEFIRGNISEILENYSEPKGEFVLILEKSQEKDENEIIKKIAKNKNTNKNEIYQYFINK